MLELYGTRSCPHTQEMREWLEWQRRDYVEYDLERDAGARLRFAQLAQGQRNVPVLVENDKIIQIGWQGRSCMIDPVR